MNDTQQNEELAAVIAANPTGFWFALKLHEQLGIEEQREWQEELQQYMRTLGVVVYCEAGFGVAMPMGRNALAADRHELTNWVMDHGTNVAVTLQLSDNLRLGEFHKHCDDAQAASTEYDSGPLVAVGIGMVIEVVTRALLDWRLATAALQILRRAA